MAHRTEIHGYRHLNEATIRIIAGRYDLNPNSSLVRSNAAQADDTHGKPWGPNGPLVGWGSDSRGYTDAAKLLDGLLDQETATARMDALAHADFCRNAY